MNDAPLSPLVPIDIMPDLMAGVNVLHENSSNTQEFITNNSHDINESPTMQSEDSISTTPRSPRLPHLQLKLPTLSPSSSDNDGDDINRPFVDGGDGSSANNGDRVTSPPPNCAICLSRCKNKCFTDSCIHQFCFKCLCEWSKVKPECPLCKQTFKSIIHNVKSIDQFEEYHVQAPTADIPAPSFDLQTIGVLNYRNHFVIVPPRNHNSLVLTSDPSSSSSRSVANSANPFDAARVTRAYPIALLDDYYRRHPDSIGDEGISHLWRTYIYDRKLYALPVSDITGRFRESSARFYRENPAQLHRLMPWIQRDIDCLIDGVSMQRHGLVHSIGEALLIMNIISAAFRRTIQPYLGTRTAHFIHELLNFARSPYDMIGYDRTVRYSPQIQEEIIIEFTLSDSSDTEDNTTIGRRSHPTVAVTSTSTVTSEAQAVVNAINLTIHDRMNITPHIRSVVRRADTNGGTDGIIELDDESDNNNDLAASTSRQEILESFQGTNNEQFFESSAIPVTDNIELSSDSSECEFVLERKPPHLRTPEMVSLDSASDSDVVFVNEVKPLNKFSFDTDDEEDMVNQENNYSVGIGLNSVSTSGGAGASAETSQNSYRSKSNVLIDVKNKQQQHSQSAAADHYEEIYNVGASTSAGLRSTTSTRSKRNSLKQNKMRNVRKSQRHKRCSTRESGATGTVNETFKPLRTNKSRRKFSLRASSTVSTTSSSSFSSLTSISTTDLSSPSSSSSDEDFQPPFIRKRYNSRECTKTKRNYNNNSKQRHVSLIEKRCKPINRNVRKRGTPKHKSKYCSGLNEVNDVTENRNNITSTNDTESNDSSNHVMKNDSLGMAVKDTLKKEKNRGQMETQKEKWETNKKGRSCRKRQRPVNIEYTDGENAWRNDAVNEPLKKQQRRQARNSYKMTQQQDQETQNDIVNDKSPKLSVSTNVFENSTTSTNKNNEQSTSRFSKRRNTLEHNYPRKLEEQQRKQRQQQQSHLNKNAIKHEYLSNDDDDNADDDDIDHLNLSILKSILKAKRSNSLSGDISQPSTEMTHCDRVNKDEYGIDVDDGAETSREVHQDDETTSPTLASSVSLPPKSPLQTLYQVNEIDESNSINTASNVSTTMTGDVEMPRSSINDTNELPLYSQSVQYESLGNEDVVAQISNKNSIITPQLETTTAGTLQITKTSSNININRNVSGDDNIVNTNHTHCNRNNDSNNNTTANVCINTMSFSASSSSAISLLSPSLSYEEECQINILPETNFLDYQSINYENHDHSNDHNSNCHLNRQTDTDDHHDHEDDDDDNHSNTSTISTGSISSTTVTDTTSDTTENDINGTYR